MSKIAKLVEELHDSDDQVVFELKSFHARQEMARQVYQKFGFNYWKLTFDQTSPIITLKRLNPQSDQEQYQQVQINHEIEVEALLKYELGFSLIVRELIKCKKPLVGHNMFLDMLFFYGQFIGALPNTLAQFNECWLQCFPVVYDTKCMASALGLFAKTNLASMASQFQSNKKYNDFIQFLFEPGFDQYAYGAKLHQAGYDSYLTGICFASMLKFLESQNLLEFQKQNGQNAAIRTPLNELFIQSQRTGLTIQVSVSPVASLAEIAYEPVQFAAGVEFVNHIQISLDGVKFYRLSQNSTSITQQTDQFDDKVLYVQFKESLTAIQITQQLNVYGDVFCVKDDEKNVFVEFQHFEGDHCPESISAALKNHSNISNVTTYKEGLILRQEIN